MSTKRIHVLPAHIAANFKNKSLNMPVIAIKEDGKDDTLCHGVEIKGPSRLVYNRDNPLKGDARVWIETDAEIILLPENASPRPQS